MHQGAKQGTWIAVGISAFLTALILLFGRQLMGVFTETAVLVDLSMRMMQILAFGSVSYTHLDVYKRQPFCRPPPEASAFAADASPTRRP